MNFKMNKYFISPNQSPKSSKNFKNLLYTPHNQRGNYNNYNTMSNRQNNNLRYEDESPIRNILYPRSHSRI